MFNTQHGHVWCFPHLSFYYTDWCSLFRTMLLIKYSTRWCSVLYTPFLYYIRWYLVLCTILHCTGLCVLMFGTTVCTLLSSTLYTIVKYFSALYTAVKYSPPACCSYSAHPLGILCTDIHHSAYWFLVIYTQQYSQYSNTLRTVVPYLHSLHTSVEYLVFCAIP